MFKLPLEGRHNARNLMLALAVAKELKIPLNKINDIDIKMPYGRNTVIKLGRLTVLDETYNASPEAVKASLELLASKKGRHFAVIGAMLELGEFSVSYHRMVAEWAVDLGLDGLVVISEGEEAEVMKEVASSMSCFKVVSTPEDALQYLLPWLKAGDFLLLKASRGVALERILPKIPRF